MSSSPRDRKASSPDIHVISPAGVVLDASRLHRARANLAARGYRVALDRAALARDRRFAGSDRSRLAAFARAARGPAPVVMITRGGYGVTRLLDALDYEQLAAADKQWVGFSDFTAFQFAMLARAGAATWSGPALLDDYADEPDDNTAEVFDDAMAGRLQILGFASRGPAGVDVTGTLWGGNLSIVCSMLGTPYWPQVRDGILFLEDVGEHPYRIERMFTQLLHAGVIDAQAAVLLGAFNGFRAAAHDGGFGLADVVRWLRRRTRTPVIEGLPFGHGVSKLTLPHGREVGLASSRGQTYLVMPDAHVH
jgi:muramoyltetrapeptide carboxypeptidase